MLAEALPAGQPSNIKLGDDKEVVRKIVDIDSDELKKFIAAGKPVIDVRIPFEWNDTGIIDGTIPILFYDEKGQPRAEEWLAQACSHIDPSREVVLLCRTGRRSRAVAEYLTDQCGYEKVYNVGAGIKGWLAEGNGTFCLLAASNSHSF